MSKKYIIMLILAIALSFVTLIVILVKTKRIEVYSKPNNSLKIGDDIETPRSLNDIYGREIQIKETMLIIFLDPNCQSCIDEIVIWNDFHKRMNNILTAFVVSYANIEILKKFIKRYDLEIPFILDSEKILHHHFRVINVPNYILTRKSKVALIPEYSNETAYHALMRIENYLKNE